MLTANPSLITPVKHNDERGSFSEIWRNELFDIDFKQINQSVSKIGTFRGLHYQWDKPQGKLIRVDNGSAIFLELDIRSYSPTFGKVDTFELNANTNNWLWVPPGFANGFFALERDTRITYMCTEYWSKNEGSIHYNSQCIKDTIGNFALNYHGGVRHISEKDSNAPTFEESIDHLTSISGFFSNNHK